jgi:hypothetical protein
MMTTSLAGSRTALVIDGPTSSDRYVGGPVDVLLADAKLDWLAIHGVLSEPQETHVASMSTSSDAA